MFEGAPLTLASTVHLVKDVELLVYSYSKSRGYCSSKTARTIHPCLLRSRISNSCRASRRRR